MYSMFGVLNQYSAWVRYILLGGNSIHIVCLLSRTENFFPPPPPLPSPPPPSSSSSSSSFLLHLFLLLLPIDTMHEMDTSISLITETWLTTQSNQQLTDMRDALGYECIRQDRGSRGGGVAIIYKTGDLHMQQIKTGTKNEIVAALGRRTGQRRKTVAIAAYLPPNLDAEKSDEVLQEIVNLIGTFKRRYNACLLYTSPSPRDRQKSRMPSSA